MSGVSAPAGLAAVALLVLLRCAVRVLRPAGAGLVSPDLRAGRRARGYGGRRLPTDRRGLAPGLPRLPPHRGAGDVEREVPHQLELEQPLDHHRLDPLDHVLEEVERLALVLRERIALPVPAEADARSEEHTSELQSQF